MKHNLALPLLAVGGLFGCTIYTGVSKVGRNVYLTGVSSFSVFSSAWVRRCVESSSALVCQDLDIESGSAPIIMEQIAVEQAPGISPEERKKQLKRAMPSLKEKLPTASEPSFPSIEEAGNLPPDALKHLQSIQNYFALCRNSHAKDVKRFTFSIDVGANGEIKQVELEKISSSSPFGGCLIRGVRTLSFPKSNVPKRYSSITIDLAK